MSAARRLSGEALDRMPAAFNMSAGPPELAAPGGITTTIRLCDVIVGHWTARQAEVIGVLLLDPQATQAAFAATAQNTRLYSSGARGQTMYTEDQKDASGDAFQRQQGRREKTKAVDDFTL